MRKRNVVLVSILVLIVVLGVAAWALGWFANEENSEEESTYRSQLTGEIVGEDEAQRAVLAVIIENTPEARPQTGLSSAGIVFESLTEGGITRYLALYQADMPEEFGPIRSLRPHFLDWAMGFDASIAHVGGSGEALETAEERGARSMDQLNNDEPYYRSSEREAPHNMYAPSEGLRDLQAELGHTRSEFAEIPRVEESPSDEPVVQTVAIEYSTPGYGVEFRYDREDNSYTRLLSDETHTDADTDEAITVKNLVVLEFEQDGDGATGSGDALVFKDGGVQEATWEQESFEERIKILNQEGNQVPLNRGTTWFAAVPPDRPVNY